MCRQDLSLPGTARHPLPSNGVLTNALPSGEGPTTQLSPAAATTNSCDHLNEHHRTAPNCLTILSELFLLFLAGLCSLAEELCALEPSI